MLDAHSWKTDYFSSKDKFRWNKCYEILGTGQLVAQEVRTESGERRSPLDGTQNLHDFLHDFAAFQLSMDLVVEVYLRD